MTGGSIPITVLVQTLNEEVAIGACLESLTDFDEVVVVDSHSTDRTAAISEAHGARVVPFRWDGTYPKKKQWQLENVPTRNRWVFFLDADERPSPELVRELRELDITARHEKAFDTALDYWFAGRLLRHGHRVQKRVIVDRENVRFPDVGDIGLPGMGELEGHYQPEVTGRTGTLEGRIDHQDPDPVGTWFHRHNKYSDWEAAIRLRPDVRDSIASARTRQGRLFDRVPGKPAVFFLYCFVLRRGFLDGRAGFDYALALAFYYWQIGLKVREAGTAR